MNPKDALKRLRKDNFRDANELQSLRRNDSRYTEAMDVKNKAKKLLNKENGIDE